MGGARILTMARAGARDKVEIGDLKKAERKVKDGNNKGMVNKEKELTNDGDSRRRRD